MAKPLMVSLGTEAFSFNLSEVERADLYGSRKRLPTDGNGRTCIRAALTQDGSLLIASGMSGQGYFNASGQYVPRGRLVGVNEQGAVVESQPSTLGLPQALEGPVEWVAGRQPFRGLAPAAIEAWITCLDARLAGQGHWRLLFSVPRLGPAGGLLALGQPRDGALAGLLQELSSLEQQALALEFAPAIHCQSYLEDRHWRLDRERWQEALTMEITPNRIERWLAEGSSWRRQLESVANRRLSQGELQQLQRGFEANLAQALPQQLEHLLVTGRRGPQSPSMGPAKQTHQKG